MFVRREEICICVSVSVRGRVSISVYKELKMAKDDDPGSLRMHTPPRLLWSCIIDLGRRKLQLRED